jgi:hypothetical protein
LLYRTAEMPFEEAFQNIDRIWFKSVQRPRPSSPLTHIGAGKTNLDWTGVGVPPARVLGFWPP